ncbi:DUF3558 domain-containing protein [Nocardia stercoris]|uniref:DUF3558 domain-containing protein n=1 Tax=Nocardia stercoris TaxID=2483361 RepID=A0A3M2L8Q7_9NOCA|nr:DUF3558 domain-containing protein [Nocardia stercoris]RMI30948.1 DUF3558 domain-containing protein [Nocardia stercoris]
MRLMAAIVSGTAVVVLSAGCGSQGSTDNQPAVKPPLKVATLGPFVGECGHVTDDEVKTVGGLGAITGSFKNSVGCNWSGGGLDGPTVTFASYRGSPIGREKAWVTSEGRNPENIEVAGKPGFKDASENGMVCDLAVQLGDDFFEWSTSAGIFGAAHADPCARNLALATLTVQRLQ